MELSDPDFPNSYREKFLITSPATSEYNCIAWAAGENTRWWEPDDEDYYWPENVPSDHQVTTLVTIFEILGYQTCNSGGYEPGIEKIALFSQNGIQCTHAARQLSDGRWTSKLGINVDISHTLFSFERGYYGKAVHFLKRSFSP